MKISIKFQWSNTVLFEGEYESVKHALQKAVETRANLYGADLYGADLRGANLYGADLRGADLRGADLRGADLRGANLYGANLYGANLYGANLYGANLYGANLYRANLYGANLYRANLYGEKLIVKPIWISGLRWEITITAEYMKIGCERHTHTEWKAFKRPRISQMDSYAYDWWKAHKDMLLGLCNVNATDADKERPAFEKYCAEQEAKLATEQKA